MRGTRCELRGTGCGVRVAGYAVQVVRCGVIRLRIGDCGFRIARQSAKGRAHGAWRLALGAEDLVHGVLEIKDLSVFCLLTSVLWYRVASCGSRVDVLVIDY